MEQNKLDELIERFRREFKECDVEFDVLVDQLKEDLESKLKEVEREAVKKFDWLTDENTGISSIALFRHMVDLNQIRNIACPHDKWDRGRCVVLLADYAPEWIERLDEMEIYYGWEDQLPMLKDELEQYLQTKAQQDKESNV